MFDLLIKGGLVVDGSARAGVARRRGDQGRAHRRGRAEDRGRGGAHARRRGPRRRAGLHRPAHPLRRAAAVGRRGQAGAGARDHLGGARQLLAVAGALEGRATARRWSACSSRSRSCRRRRSPRRSTGPGRTSPAIARAIEPSLSINVAPLVGHSVIRLWVMGADAHQRAARPDEIAAMQDVLRAMPRRRRGRPFHQLRRRRRERPARCRRASPRSSELDALSAVLGEHGRMLQIVPEFYATDITIARIDQLAELSLKHDIPTTFSPLFDSALAPENAPRALRRVGRAVRPGRAGLAADADPADRHQLLAAAPQPLLRPPAALGAGAAPAARRADRRAEGRRDLPKRWSRTPGPTAAWRSWARWWCAAATRRRRTWPAARSAEIAAERGETPARALINVSLEHGLDVGFVAASRGHDDTGRIGPMLANPLVHIGASDGGAHLASFATYGDTGYLFSEFVRKRRRAQPGRRGEEDHLRHRRRSGA